MNFLQKKRDSKRNLFLKIKNIICYYQTRGGIYPFFRSKCISKHHMLLPNEQALRDLLKAARFQNIICYYQTKRNCIKLTLTIISKHHMLLPNNIPRVAICSKNDFKTSYVITKLCGKWVWNAQIRNFKTSYVITKPTCAIRNITRRFDFKTSYVITKHLILLIPNLPYRFQNIICYYQTFFRCRNDWRYVIISKHHMLLPNPRF